MLTIPTSQVRDILDLAALNDDVIRIAGVTRKGAPAIAITIDTSAGDVSERFQGGIADHLGSFMVETLAPRTTVTRCRNGYQVITITQTRLGD
ncbi:hypothetical protein AB0395_34930 [Streptosporangium sp. NPDC051023]|uniref:hypothetical protein n=1 Tax=Streptosporangium sp. NPDC051023 TaxID=3155410 RepID=UPI00344E440F